MLKLLYKNLQRQLLHIFVTYSKCGPLDKIKNVMSAPNLIL
jgi:hypothetical protein